MFTITRKTAVLSVLAAGALAVSATSPALAGPGHKKFSFGMPGKASKVTRVVRLNASDVKFDKTQLTFRVGETVKFVIVNTGEGDHEMTIGDAATQLAHRKEMEKLMDSGKMGHHAHGHSNATYVKPGKTKMLIWKFTKVGSFEFGCNIPGHYEAGMKGRIKVSG